MDRKAWLPALSIFLLGASGGALTVKFTDTGVMTLDEADLLRSRAYSDSERVLVAANYRRAALRCIEGLRFLAIDTPFAVETLDFLAGKLPR